MSSAINTTDPIALSFNECLLRKSDINLLKGPYWLNDQIISFYFEYLEKVMYPEESHFLFVSPEVTQCIKIVSSQEIPVFLEPLKANQRQFIFFPLNDNERDSAGGSHWSLLLFSRPENAFFHYDSSKGSNTSNSVNFVKGIKYALNAPTAILTNAPSLQQSNGYDCGIHVLCMADVLTDHIIRSGHAYGVPLLKYSTIQAKRGEVLTIVRQLGGRI